MSRMNQVMQIGNIEGDIVYYIEDYAYTYLKKQKGKEKTKYYLYGEKEESGKEKKIYIYGIAEKPKMEQTYFKEYYPLGFLKMNRDELFWINLKGQEQKIAGYYVFYAPNQAMQEYLVDYQKEETTDKPLDKTKRQLNREALPMKETMVIPQKVKKQKKNTEFKNEKFIVPIGGIVIACLILLVLTSSNGQKKVEIFRQVIAETMSGMIKEVPQEDFIIEEKNKDQKNLEQINTTEENVSKLEEVNDTSSTKNQEKGKTDLSLQENVISELTNNFSEEENILLEGVEKKQEEMKEDTETEQEEIKEVDETERGEISNIKMKEEKLETKKEENTETKAEKEKENVETEEKKEDSEIKKAENKENTKNKEKEEKSKNKIEENKEYLETGKMEKYEEYVVKNGDTLVGICTNKYGSLVKMNEICNINNIKNADYIAPGQKIYLP